MSWEGTPSWLISVIIPTIKGREKHLDRAITAYTRTTKDFELIVVNDKPTCGVAWNEGLRTARGKYLHLSADDLVPHEGWWEAAIECCESGSLPCPLILNPNDTIQSCGPDANLRQTGAPSDVARVPFFPRSLLSELYPVFENQYMGDYWITWKAAQAGWPTVVWRECVFTHYTAGEGRLDTLAADLEAFRVATA